MPCARLPSASPGFARALEMFATRGRWSRFIDRPQWIPELTGPEALNCQWEQPSIGPCRPSFQNTTGYRQASPKRRDHRPPRFTRIDDQTFDAMDWDVRFLIEAGFAPKVWQPVIRGHAVTGDIIAPIRKLSETKATTHEGAAAVAEALVNIRSYFMPSAQSRSSETTDGLSSVKRRKPGCSSHHQTQNRGSHSRSR